MIIDTTALVALVDEGHEWHAEVRVRLRHGPLSVTRGSLAELTQILWHGRSSRGDGGHFARSAVAAIMAHPAFREASDVPLADVMGLYHAHPGLSLVDAWNLAAAWATGEELVTHDRVLARLWAEGKGRTRPARR
jgi:predicted nucleic acid-binding protein